MDILPMKFSSEDPLPPGLVLLHGKQRSAKTVNSYALKLQLEAKGYTCEYCNIMEPRGAMFTSKAVSSMRSEDAAYVIADTYNSWLDKRLDDLVRRNRVVSRDKVPVFIADSITYLIKELAITKAMLDKAKTTTFKEGLGSADILGILQHNAFAAVKGVCLIGTVNSELLPVVKLLSGAAEGIAESVGPGIIEIETRASARQRSALSLDPTYVSASFKKLYDVEWKSMGSFGSNFKSTM